MNKAPLLAAAALAALTTLSGCGPKSPAITDCSAVDGLQPICRFHDPEDLALLPDGKTLVVSQMGNFVQKKPGNLALFDTVTQQVSEVFPNPDTPRGADNWGDAGCPGMPGAEFAPHGIALGQRSDGRWELAAIDHGRRETVELFEVTASDGHYGLIWHGCAVPPTGIFMNDLALLRDGGLIASDMYDPRKPEIGGMNIEMYLGLLGMNTGYVFEWHPNQGIRKLPGSDMNLPNGIALSPDERTVFASSTGGNVVLKFDRASGKLLGQAPVRQPDNLSWDSHGRLLAAGYAGSRADQMDCTKAPGGNCSGGIDIVRIDPATMQATHVLKHMGPPIGTASIAYQVGDHLYIGSFTGDRLVTAPYP